MNLINSAKQNNIILTERFTSELTVLEPMFEDVQNSKKREMMFVAQLASYRNYYNQRSEERQFYDGLLDEIGVSAAARTEYTQARNFYNKLISKGGVFEEIAEAATPYQLLEMQKCSYTKKDFYYLLHKHYDKVQKLPTVKQFRQWRNGQVNDSFKEIVIAPPVEYSDVRKLEPPTTEQQPSKTDVIDVVCSSSTKTDDTAITPIPHPARQEYRNKLEDASVYELATALLERMKTTKYISSQCDDALSECQRKIPDMRRRGYQARNNQPIFGKES